MPPLSNDRWERFCLGVHAGKTHEQAYIDAGYAAKGARANSSRLIANDSVQARLKELRGQTAKRAQITMGEVLDGLRGIAEDGQAPHSARVSAFKVLYDHLADHDDMPGTGPSDADLEAADRRLRLVRPA